MSDDNMQMDEQEFLRAKFFAPEGEIERERAEADVQRAKRQSLAAKRAEVRAIRHFVKALDAMERNGQVAALRYLCDRYKVQL